jgi:predicted RNA-binding Zn ribbon-like protein
VSADRGDTFDFVADRPVLDFVATVAERGTTHVDKLPTTDALARWVAESGLVERRVSVSARDLARAKQLREAMFALLTALIDRTRPREADRRLVNRAAAGARPVNQLSASGHVRRVGDLDAVLALLATDCIELFDGPERDLLARCADSACTRLFIDRSRGRRRRWCEMKGCGDRAKAAAYRRRRLQARR